MKLIPDLKEFLELLISANVQYLVIGGWAINRYIEPRFTGDIDLFVGSSKTNEELLREVLVSFGFDSVLPPKEKSLFTKKVIMLGRPPGRIDLLSEIDGITFEEAWKNRESGRLDGLQIWFISKSDLIRNKKASGPDKDLLDIMRLEAYSED